jgi:hypothetical protein
MPLRPPVQTNSKSLIASLAAKAGLDPAAVLAVAAGEGGFANRANDVGDLSGGGSYGPFQLYAKGALPAQYRGRPQAADAWAWSPAGIQYALGRMVASGAKGLRGRAAIDTIVRKFERPYDPNKSVSNALARYSQYNGAGGAAPSTSALPGSSLPAPALAQSTQMPQAPNMRRNALLQGLIAGQDIHDILPSLPAASLPTPTLGGINTRLGGGEALRTAPSGRSVDSNVPSTIKIPTTGTHVNTSDLKPSFAQKLSALIAASGGRLKASSGFRPVEQQAQLFAAAVKKYGSEAAARKWVAPPGKSRHGHGDAADIQGDLKWAHANAKRFGLYFPMSWENWHIEEIGSR